MNTIRHQSVFSPARWGNRRIDILGIGAVGLRIANEVARLGVRNLHIWDKDLVEAHNVPNQMYGICHVGMRKVEAAGKMIKEYTGLSVMQHDMELDGTQRFGEVVFLAVDRMSTRRKIYEGSLKFKGGVRLVIEVRMGVDNGRIYAYNPCSLVESEAWERTLYEDGKGPTTPCGGSISVGPTAARLAGDAVWQFIRWVEAEQGEKSPSFFHEVIFLQQPHGTVLRREFK